MCLPAAMNEEPTAHTVAAAYFQRRGTALRAFAFGENSLSCVRSERALASILLEIEMLKTELEVKVAELEASLVKARQMYGELRLENARLKSLLDSKPAAKAAKTYSVVKVLPTPLDAFKVGKELSMSFAAKKFLFKVQGCEVLRAPR